MGEYLDNTYAAIDGVLLSYNGGDISLSLPHRLADMDIHTIGSGAVMESQKLQQVVVPDGVRRIGEKAFRNCSQLRSVYLPYSVKTYGRFAFCQCMNLRHIYIYNYGMDRQKYRDLKAASMRVNGVEYLAGSFPDSNRIRSAVMATDSLPANVIRGGITRLFTSQSMEEERGAESLRRNLDGFGIDSPDRYQTEETELTRLLGSTNPVDTDAHSEAENDRFLKSDKVHPIEKTAVFSFDDSKTRVKNGKYYIFAEIRIGFHFWQSVVPIRTNGKTYYLYRRHYLSGEPNLNYVRREAAIYTENGLVIERKEAQEVYAKYKLLSIL